MTVCDSPSSRIARPIAPGSPPRRLLQNDSLTMTTLACSRASSGTNVRPAIGAIPSRSKNPVVTACAGMRSAAPLVPVRVRPPSPAIAAIHANDPFCSDQSRKFNGETRLRAYPGGCSYSMTSRSGSAKGSARISAPSIRLNMALVAPMPTPMTSAASAANPGALRMDRTASRMSVADGMPLRRSGPARRWLSRAALTGRAAHRSGGHDRDDPQRAATAVHDLQWRGDDDGSDRRQLIQIAEAREPELAGAVHDRVIRERRIESARLAGVGADRFDADP